MDLDKNILIIKIKLNVKILEIKNVKNLKVEIQKLNLKIKHKNLKISAKKQPKMGNLKLKINIKIIKNLLEKFKNLMFEKLIRELKM